jgi:hypothetical protein
VYFGFALKLVGGARWRSWLRHYATNRNIAGSIPDGVIGINSLTKSFRSHYGSGVDSASNRNEFQKYFLGGKGGRCVGLTSLPPSCADCLQIWEPQPPGPLRACLLLPLPLPTTCVYVFRCYRYSKCFTPYSHRNVFGSL